MFQDKRGLGFLSFSERCYNRPDAFMLLVARQDGSFLKWVPVSKFWWNGKNITLGKASRHLRWKV